MWETECSLDLSLRFLTSIKKKSVERKNRTNVSFLLAASLNRIRTKQDHLLVIRTRFLECGVANPPDHPDLITKKNHYTALGVWWGNEQSNVSLCSQFAATSGHGLEQNVCRKTFVIMIFLMTGAERIREAEETLQRSSALRGTIYPQYPWPISDCFVSILSWDSLSVQHNYSFGKILIESHNQSPP